MFPILFQLGPFTLHSFGAMMALGFISSLYVMRFFSRKGMTPLDEFQLSRLIVWLMLGGVAGARLAYVAEHWRSEFAGNLAAIVRIDQGGLMFYGGVAGAILAIVVFAGKERSSPLKVLDICAAVLPLGHAFGRLGCFLNGCCYGMACDVAIGVRFPAGSLAWRDQVGAGVLPASAAFSLPVLPTQLIEMFANLLLFAALYAVFRRKPRSGTLTALYLVAYAVIRFGTEFARGDERLTTHSLSIGQWISVAVLVAGLVLLTLIRRKGQRAET